MAKISNAQKLGIVTRVATRQIRQSRTFGAVMRAARATASHWMHALGQLWLEVTGFVFLALAGIGALAFFREYARAQAAHTGYARVWVAIAFSMLFAWFGLSSFWRVKKKG